MVFNSKKVLSITVGFFVIACATYFLVKPRRGQVFETWQTGNSTFRLRVTAYKEKNTFPALGGGYYVFESAGLNSDQWKQIMTFRHDDPVAIPRDQIRFLSDQVAYAFMGWMYAVTTDRGSTWSVWNAERDIPDWRCCNYKYLHQVDIDQNGAGVMTLDPIDEHGGTMLRLHTQDYGRHWRAE